MLLERYLLANSFYQKDGARKVTNGRSTFSYRKVPPRRKKHFKSTIHFSLHPESKKVKRSETLAGLNHHTVIHNS